MGFRFSNTWRLCGAVVAVSVDNRVGATAAACRDQLLWPFNASSWWNTPVGGSAVYRPSGLFSGLRPGEEAPEAIGNDDDFLITPSEARGDPMVDWYNQGHWGHPYTPAAYCNITGPLVKQIRFPANLTINDFGHNNAAAILQDDNRTLLLMQPIYKCSADAPVTALEMHRDNTSDIRGIGDGGGHGGSGLNAIGGTIRLGELLPGAPPIAHAIKLEFFAAQYYYKPIPCNMTECFRWPATACDGYYCGNYNGTNPLMRPGSLLAVPPSIFPTLNASLRTEPARRLAAALLTYGGYIADDSACNATNVCTQFGVADEFQAAYGYPFAVWVYARAGTPAAQWYADLVALFRTLHVVDSNAPSAPGGGGTPLAPPPPPFCNY